MKDIEYNKQVEIKIINIKLDDNGNIEFWLNGQYDYMKKKFLWEWKQTRDMNVWLFVDDVHNFITPEAIDMMIKEMWGEE